MAIEQTENNENQVNWEQYGRWSASVPEGATDKTDVVLFIRPGGHDTPPGYEELAEDHPDKIVIYGTAGDGFTVDEIPEVVGQIEANDGVEIGAIDVNAHSRTDKYAVLATNALADNGYTVANTNIFDGNATLAYMDMRKTGKGLSDSDWQHFSSSGSNLNVFSRGADGLYKTEIDRLDGAVRNGVPVTYTVCNFDGNSDWDEKHAAVPRDLIANNVMDVFDGKSDTFNFDTRLTKADNSFIADRPAHVTGFDWSMKYDYDQKQWVKTYDSSTMGSDYSGLVSSLSANSSLYHTTSGALSTGSTLSPLIGSVHDEMNHMLTMVSAFSGSFNDSIVTLPKSDDLVVCKEELIAFKSSGVLTELNKGITESGNLQNLIAAFRNNGLLKGDVWNLAYDKLDVYDEALAKMAEAAAALGTAIAKAIDELLACYDRYPDIPADKIQTSNLPELNIQIADLREQIKGIPPEIPETNEVTGETYMVANPAYEALETQINEMQHLIDAITDFKETYERVKIELDAAMEDLRAFGNMVAGITPSSSYTYQ